MRLAELQQLAPQLHELLARHGASNPAVFGSVARDQALPGVRRHRKLSQRRHQN
jgi:predicted nucleotidyltransferase